ncbi:MAG: hypothetical protein HY094_07815 [Candidatus Melainabacteria bacterium]|nr:hypothetical protein [Candidatus Melainabacteria bacterium]
MRLSKQKTTLFSIAICAVFSFLPAKSSSEGYDKILERLEKVQTQENTKEEEPKTWSLTFEHDKLPKLDGTWILTKTTTKRVVNPLLTKPTTFVHCNSRLPFEKRDFEEKEVVVSSRGPDYFLINSKYPTTKDVYHDPNLNEDIEYHNFSFKAVIDPEDITYAYTLRLNNHKENPALARELWLNGKLKFEYISRNKILAKGYEIEYTPECQGFIRDEIKFQLVKTNAVEEYHENGLDKLSLLEQPAYAEDNSTGLDTAKDRSGFKPSAFYKKIDSTLTPNKKAVKVPGMW